MYLPVILFDNQFNLSHEQQQQLRSCLNFEQFLFYLFSFYEDKKFSFVVMEEIAGQKNFVICIDNAFEPGSKSVIQIDAESLQKSVKFQPLLQKMITLSDQNKKIIDQEWFEKRNRRLKIKLDDYNEQQLAPASALSELILSYAFAPNGMAIVQQEFLDIGKWPREALSLKLIFLGCDLNGDDGWVEQLVIPMDKIRTLLLNRSSKPNQLGL
jgi:hypothetical protein